MTGLRDVAALLAVSAFGALVIHASNLIAG